MAKKNNNGKGFGCFGYCLGAFVGIIVIGLLISAKEYVFETLGLTPVTASSSDAVETNSEYGDEVDTYDPYDGFTIGWHRSTKRSTTYYLYDPTNNKLVSVMHDHGKTKNYHEEDCVGNLEEGLYIIPSNGEPVNPDKHYKYEYKTIMNSTWIVHSDPNGNYEEWDMYTKDDCRGIQYLKKTTYAEDHKEQN